MDDGPGQARLCIAVMNSPVMPGPSSTAETGSAPELSIVVVSWNCREILARCLRAVFESRMEMPFEVIVVDNASTDGTPQEIPRLFPEVRLLANPDNLGFGKANNQGFRVARGRWIMLLNPDAFPATPDTFAGMLRFLEAHPEFAGAGCRLVHADGSHQVGDAGFKATPGNVVAYASGLSQFFPGRGGLFLGKVPAKAGWIDVDWICGAFFIIGRTVIETVGGFDERYFMYGEDIEWGCRIRRHGYRLAYVPGETVMHLQGGTQDAAVSEKISTRWLESLGMLYGQVNEGRGWAWFKLAMALGFSLRAIVYLAVALILRRPKSRAKSRAMMAYARYMWIAPWRAPVLSRAGGETPPA